MTALSAEQEAMVALFQRHVDAELAGDLDTTMADDRRSSSQSRRVHRPGRFTPRRAGLLSRSSRRQVLSAGRDDDECVAHRRARSGGGGSLSFTHTKPVDRILPGVRPLENASRSPSSSSSDSRTSRMSTSGIRPACWSRSACSILWACRYAAPKERTQGAGSKLPPADGDSDLWASSAQSAAFLRLVARRGPGLDLALELASRPSHGVGVGACDAWYCAGRAGRWRTSRRRRGPGDAAEARREIDRLVELRLDHHLPGGVDQPHLPFLKVGDRDRG